MSLDKGGANSPQGKLEIDPYAQRNIISNPRSP
jgi:hypothetical protein